MLTEQNALMKALRRSASSSSLSNSSSISPSPSPTPASSPLSWIHLRSILLLAASSSSSSSSSPSSVSTKRGGLKSPWSRGRRKHALQPKQWKSLFTPDGKVCDGGIKFLRKARRGGVDPSIRAEVWPFLLGVYDLNSSREERHCVQAQKRKEYESLRKHCQKNLKCNDKSFKLKEWVGISCSQETGDLNRVASSPGFEDNDIARRSPSLDGDGLAIDDQIQCSGLVLEGDGDKRVVTCEDDSTGDSESTDSDSSEELENVGSFLGTEIIDENDFIMPAQENPSPYDTDSESKCYKEEDFATWQKIMRVDAIRANAEWIKHSPSQAEVSEVKARQLAVSVGLKDYDHLESCRIFHAARLVAILEAYALLDPEIGYCQGMSDLLSPIIVVLEEDYEAFWCFVGFMKKARHNFQLDEVGIRRQLDVVSKIIKCKDIHLYRHLEKLQAEDCFFVYRMVVVLFSRELSLEQTLCLWEVMWADQAAIRAGIAKSTWGRIRLRAPPTNDLLLYAIAACVLQRRKLIIEKYSSVDEIIKECNSMISQLDVWRLLDDAHDLVVSLHDKI